MRPYEALWFQLCRDHPPRNRQGRLPRLADAAYWMMKVPLYAVATMLGARRR